MMTDDKQLLRKYLEERSESAFAEIVTRHIDLVYSTALRVVNGDAHLAEDVTQMVFIDLARKAASLPTNLMLPGWLHRHTSYTAATAVRTEQRRRTRERIAMEMRALDQIHDSPWEQISPHLDDGLNELKASDRDALILRFLMRQDMRAVGAALGISDDTAQKRISRALAKLRSVLHRRGVTLSAAALNSILPAQAVTSAPAGLAATTTAASLAASAETGTVLTFLKIMASTKLKAGLASALILASVSVPFVVQQTAQSKLSKQDEATRRLDGRIAGLQSEHDRLWDLVHSRSPAPQHRQFNEVLRLRGETALLLAEVQELSGSTTNEPLSREEILTSMRQMYRDRVNSLKQRILENPAEAVPELQYLKDRDWLSFVTYDHHRIDPDNRRAMSHARYKGQHHFAMHVVHDALKRFAGDNHGQSITDLSQLLPYFRTPADAAVLEGWTLLSTKRLPKGIHADDPWVITQKGPRNAQMDQRIVVGLKTMGAGRGGTNDWAILD